MSHPRARRRQISFVGPVLAFFTAWAFRFLSMGALENDHFVALARAHQILHGDWPVRDFFDPGQPLAYLASAVTASLGGPTLLSDVALSITLLALAAALTYALAYRACGSVLIAVAAVTVELAASPRLYNAGKLLFPLGAIALGWRYADAPSLRRLVSLAAWTALAFLWRHDYGLYIGIPVMVLLLLCHDRARAVSLIWTYAALCVACLLPWLVYVHWASGLGAYASSAIMFAIAEGQRTSVGGPVNARQVAVLLVLVGIPLVSIALARSSRERLAFAHVTFASGIALIASVFVLRDVITTRMPDIVGLEVVLAAWIAGCVVSKPLLRLGAAVALVTVTGIVATTLAAQGYGFPTPGKVVRRFSTVASLFRTNAPEVVPNRERMPLIRYIATCTPGTSRVLVSGFGPEIPVLAGRPFAGGLPSWVPGYYTSAREVERAAAQLSREPVSIAVMLEGSAVFEESWPRLASDLRARHFVERAWRIDGSDIVVWIPEDLAARAPSAPPSCDAR